MLNKIFLNSRSSGIERSIRFFQKIIKFYFNGFTSKWNRTVHYFFRRENKENFILMYSRISGLELCVSIRCENFRLEY